VEVQLTEFISGSWGDADGIRHDYPPQGSVVELPDALAEDLVRMELAEPVEP
jgi:hypothetical protein